jgi:hypothetical protein
MEDARGQQPADTSRALQASGKIKAPHIACVHHEFWDFDVNFHPLVEGSGRFLPN